MKSVALSKSPDAKAVIASIPVDITATNAAIINGIIKSVTEVVNEATIAVNGATITAIARIIVLNTVKLY